MSLGIFEVLSKADQAKTREEKVRILRENYSPGLRDILIGALDERVKWLLPPGAPTYTPLEPIGAEVNLHAQTRSLYLYTEGGGAPENLAQSRREYLFKLLLEAVHPEDAKILLAMKDKTLPYKSITGELVNEAFPGMLALPPQGEPQGPFQPPPVSDPPKTEKAAKTAPRAAKRKGGWPKGKPRGPRKPKEAAPPLGESPPPLAPSPVPVAVIPDPFLESIPPPANPAIEKALLLLHQLGNIPAEGVYMTDPSVAEKIPAAQPPAEGEDVQDVSDKA